MTRSLSFGFEGNNVRVMMDERGEPWWVAKDVCEILGIEKHRDAIARLDDGERASTIADSPGGPQEMATISESGLYRLAFKSLDVLPVLKDGDSCYQRVTSDTENVLSSIGVSIMRHTAC